jgi:DNA adenine methylase
MILETGYVKSPLNYIGGKYGLLGNILSILPDNINRFCDLFCGGLNVGINVNANTIYANDQITYIMQLYEIFKTANIDSILSYIDSMVSEYALSDTNADGYNRFREEYNRTRKPLDLFILLCYSFNNQIRFNSNHDFNMPFGMRTWNDSIKYNLIRFCKLLNSKNFILSSLDFRSFDFSSFESNDVVYCDPPYLLTVGTYNDGKRGFNGWAEKDDIDLMNLLDALNSKGIKFILSNVLEHHWKKNDNLIEWSKQYNIIYVDKDYSNCNYQVKDEVSKTREVLILNYQPAIDYDCTLF